MRMTIAAAALALVAGATGAEACPDWRAQPHFGQIELWAGFRPDPYSRSITAGGNIAVGPCLGNGWVGYVTRRPDFDLYWHGSTARLSIVVDTAADSILLVNGPDGTWYFNDDLSQSDRRSVVTIERPQEGLYDIWIGSYDGSRRNPGRLYITEQ